MEMFCIFIMVVVTLLYIFVQIYQIIYKIVPIRENVVCKFTSISQL